MIRWGMRQRAIKEAIDNLPSGLCFFAPNGLLILCNKTMYRLAFLMSGRDPQTLKEMQEFLENPPEESSVVKDGSTYLLQDGSAWKFSIGPIRDRAGVVYTQTIATDVSELYHGTKELEENVKKLKEVQEHIRSMMQNITAITRENEILSMKMQIHDELGSSLLKLRRYRLGTDGESREKLLENWQRTVSMLRYRSRSGDEDDPMADLLRSASSIGVKIVRNGTMPADPTAARLLVRAVRQCLTNAVRHADGSCIHVELTQSGGNAAAVITNDGRPPESEIVEGSGLSSLRMRIENEGGTMKIRSLPTFALYVTVPVMTDHDKQEPDTGERS